MSYAAATRVHRPAEPLAWMDDAACWSSAEDFFPERRAWAHHAKAVCKECPVRLTCLDYALEHNEAGIWGGTDWEERAVMRRKARQRRGA